jgi:hypothetical protein
MRKPLSLVMLDSCTFLASSFSSMTCLRVRRVRVSASLRVKLLRCVLVELLKYIFLGGNVLVVLVDELCLCTF